MGDPLPAFLVRRIILLKANSLAAGYSGIRSEVVDTLIEMLNADVLPIIPSRGSVGASGDLAPLAHMTLALIGEGEAIHNGRRLEGPTVLASLDRSPITLEAKEGLALLNGTQVSAALAMAGLLAGDTQSQVCDRVGVALVQRTLAVLGACTEQQDQAEHQPKGGHSRRDDHAHVIRLR